MFHIKAPLLTQNIVNNKTQYIYHIPAARASAMGGHGGGKTACGQNIKTLKY
jgi:hypothetical protein